MRLFVSCAADLMYYTCLDAFCQHLFSTFFVFFIFFFHDPFFAHFAPIYVVLHTGFVFFKLRYPFLLFITQKQEPDKSGS